MTSGRNALLMPGPSNVLDPVCRAIDMLARNGAATVEEHYRITAKPVEPASATTAAV